MPAQTGYNQLPDKMHPGVNNNLLQQYPVITDVYAAMADDDTVAITLPENGDSHVLPTVEVARHTGGDITSLAAATRAMTDGDTASFFYDDTDSGVYTEVVHTFTGLTAANATPAQIAASINGDADLSPYMVAIASLTANAVTLFPRLPRSKVYVGAQPAVLGFAGVADYSARTYVSQSNTVLTAGTGWSWSYVVSTRVLTVKNETGGAVNRVAITVRR